MLIGLTGRAGSGKSSVSGFLETNYGFHRKAFADPVKKTVSDLFRIPIDCFYDPEEKIKTDPMWNITRRKILQIFGTECIRNHFGADFWVKLMVLDIADLRQREGSGVDIVIDDVRFPEEARMIHDNGGKIISIKRPDNPYEIDQTHISETFKTIPFDKEIINDYSLLSLFNQVHNIFKV